MRMYILYVKPEYLQEGVGEGSECGDRISGANYLIAFHNNYGTGLSCLVFKRLTLL